MAQRLMDDPAIADAQRLAARMRHLGHLHEDLIALHLAGLLTGNALAAAYARFLNETLLVLQACVAWQGEHLSLAPNEGIQEERQ